MNKCQSSAISVCAKPAVSTEECATRNTALKYAGVSKVQYRVPPDGDPSYIVCFASMAT